MKVMMKCTQKAQVTIYNIMINSLKLMSIHLQLVQNTTKYFLNFFQGDDTVNYKINVQNGS